MKKEIYLKDIKNKLDGSLIKIKHKILIEILIQASNSKKFYENKIFIKKLGLSYNKYTKKSIGLYSLFKRNRAIKFETLRKVVNLSKTNWKIIEKNTIGIRYGKGDFDSNIKFPILLDKYMGSIIGHVLGDGCIDSKYMQVSFYNKDRNLIKEFYYSMKKIFNIEPRIWVQKSGKFKTKNEWIKRLNSVNQIPKDTQIALFYPSLCGRILNIIFNNFAIGKEKKFTKIMMNLSNEFKIGLIRAFFDDEGHVDKKRGPRFHQDNLQVLTKIRETIEILGIKCNPIHFFLKNNKKRYFFNINHRNNYTKYYELIGSTSKNKNSSLEKLINNNKYVID